MNHTPNYQLSQWEATDQVQRADFNADNAKIDAAIAAARKAPCCVTGTYVGNQETVTVNVGFRPSFLVILSGSRGATSLNYMSAMGGEDRILVSTFGGGTYHSNKYRITDTGFAIDDVSDYSLTAKGLTFRYFAFY